jgi:hypothetical protein
VPEHTFEVLLQEMEHGSAVDFWRLGLLKTAVAVTFFTAEQAMRLLSCFQWSADRVEAAILLFVRVVDTENLHQLTHEMSQGARSQCPAPPPPSLSLLDFRPCHPVVIYCNVS